MKFKILCIISLILASKANMAHGGIMFFDDQTNWQAAAGTISFAEDFSGFVSDTPFRTSPIELNGMSIVREGAAALNSSFRNVIDTPSLQYTDNNGTANASSFTEGDGDTSVRIRFNDLASAFGFETWGANSGEGVGLEVSNGATLLGNIELTDDRPAFTGFVLDGGDLATSVRFYSVNANGTSGGEGFGLDNLKLVNAAVPEPTSVTLWGMGALGMMLSRRKRDHASRTRDRGSI